VYLLMNGVYLFALPLGELTGTGDAGEAAANALFGPLGGMLVAGFVLVSVLGTLNATVLVGPRIAYAMSLDGLFFKSAQHVHTDFRTPTGAILLQGVVSVGLLLVLRSFPSALDFTTFAVVLATSADVAALYLLRWRQPERPRPYRAWGYPVVPALYLLANLAIAVAMILGRPLECAVGFGMLLAGLPFYWLFLRQNDASGEAQTTRDE
jgi:APA family basic amino acid/polyamine antiporter